MIHRKWSLFTGPVVILGGIVGTVVVSHYLIVGNDRFLKTEKNKSDASYATK